MTLCATGEDRDDDGIFTVRVVFFGFQTWGQRTLQALIDSGHTVPLAVTHPSSEQSYRAIFSDSVEDLARANGIDVHLTDRADAETIELVRRAEPDLIVVNSWYTWMSADLYAMPKYGTINLHDSLLPKFTGFSPVLWALISGADEFGLTIHRMDEQLDTGDILLQRSLPIGPTATGTELVEAGLELIPEALNEALTAIESGTAQWTPQDKSARTYFHKRSDRDSLLDWTWPAADLERLVRALSDPYPSAFTYYRGERIEVISAQVSSAVYGGTQGRVVVQEGGGLVICGPESFRGQNQGLIIKQVRLADGSEVSGEEFFTRGGYLTETA